MKTKFPREQALAVVRELTPLLAVMCERDEPGGVPIFRVAGSLRRGKAEVGDVELVYVPKLGTVPDGLFTKPGNLFDATLEGLIERRVLAKRQNVNGHTMWGKQNKLALHVASGVPIDFFATTRAAFWNYLVCRTGGKENNVAISVSAAARGLKWHPTHEGFEVVDSAVANRALGRTDLTARAVVRVTSEEAVFEIAGMEWKEPKERL